MTSVNATDLYAVNQVKHEMCTRIKTRISTSTAENFEPYYEWHFFFVTFSLVKHFKTALP